MIFSEKLQIIRKNRGMTQEELAEKLQISRQSVAKWESGQSYPDIMNLIQISQLFHVTVDYLVKDEECGKAPVEGEFHNLEELAAFLVEAKKNTYAGYGTQVEASRPGSHDFSYEKDDYFYLDSYVGGEQFSGEEVAWVQGTPVFSMNYCGRTLSDSFSGDFLKEALRGATIDRPYRGPVIYQAGEYAYQCQIHGDMNWFQGYEEIYFHNEKVYECFFHGGMLKG